MVWCHSKWCCVFTFVHNFNLHVTTSHHFLWGHTTCPLPFCPLPFWTTILKLTVHESVLSSYQSFIQPELTQPLSLTSSRWALRAQVAPGRLVTCCSLQERWWICLVLRETLALPPTEQASCQEHARTHRDYDGSPTTTRELHSLLQWSTAYTTPSFTLWN